MQLRRSTTKKIKATLDMTPMIDVMFLLIIFFLLSSTFVVQSSVPVELSPSPAEAVTYEGKQLTITVQPSDGRPDNEEGVYVDDLPIRSWTELEGLLQALTSRDPQAQVLIRPDKAVSTERLLYVMGRARKAGVSRFGLATESPRPEMHSPTAEVAPVPSSGSAPSPQAAPGQGP